MGSFEEHRNGPEPEKKIYNYLVSNTINENIEIRIEQTKQNFGIEYQIKKDAKLLFVGYDSFIEKHLPARMEDPSGNVVFKYNQDLGELVKSQIPVSKQSDRNGFVLNDSNDQLGKIYQVGFGQNRYYCIDYNDETLEIFMWSTGRNPHLSVFLNCNQIAQIEQENVTDNYLNKYVLYLLHDYEKYEKILSFFTLIYDKYEYGNHGEAFYGSKTDVSFSYSIKGIGMDNYFADFMKMNFPNVEIINEKPTLENISQDLKEGWETAKRSVYTREAYERLKKKLLIPSLIFGVILAALVSILSIYLGLVVLVICSAGFPLFFWMLSKICKY